MTLPLPSDSSRSASQPTEYTPLIGGQIPAQHNEDESERPSSGSHTNCDEDECKSNAELYRPLPRFQILLLCYTRIMEPMAFTSIFPYVAEMVQRNGNLHVSNIGFYSGLVESIFSATQAVCLIFWRIYADRLGHKRMLVYSLTGMAAGQVLFGMSSNLWQMILFRSITGIFSSSNLIIRMMIGELCTKKSQAKAFSWYSIAANIGIMFGPVIGGALVDPVLQYPSVFKESWFFEKYPFALPGFVVGAFSATAAITSELFLIETLKKENTSANIDDDRDNTQKYSNITTWQLLISPETSGIFWSNAHIMVCWTAIMALLPVIFYTPIELGGMQFSQTQITVCLSVLGACDTVWMFFVFPFLQRRVGTKGIMQTGSFMWPCFYAGFIIANALLRRKSKEATTAAFIVGLLIAFLGSAVGMSFTAAQLAVNEASPSPELLGKLNYIAELSSSIIRSIIPAISTAIFAVGVRENIFSGYLALLILIVFALGLPIILKKVKIN